MESSKTSITCHSLLLERLYPTLKLIIAILHRTTNCSPSNYTSINVEGGLEVKGDCNAEFQSELDGNVSLKRSYFRHNPTFIIFRSNTHGKFKNSICEQISHNSASTHAKSNLKFYQKWTVVQCTSFHSAHCISLQDSRSAFCCSFFLTLWKPQVHGFVCNELGLHRQLFSSDITQYGMIWVQRRATKGHNLVSGLHSSSSFI